ncbi:hypothetical protein LNO36_29930 [Klebsiella variicola subsp. variicola]|nr:hypothetical protein [Klebsiella variicola subsp. variicola]
MELVNHQVDAFRCLAKTRIQLVRLRLKSHEFVCGKFQMIGQFRKFPCLLSFLWTSFDASIVTQQRQATKWLNSA